MLYLAIGLFVLAAMFGVVLLMNVLGNKNPPSMVILLHGICAALGLMLVIYYTIENDLNDLWLITSLFVVAALGGLVLVSFKLRKKAPPKFMALIHPLIAGIALISLITYVLR